MSQAALREKKRYYRKNADFCNLVEKIKLWPSRSGKLHGIKSLTRRGDRAEIETHCNRRFIIYNSRHSRAARWLRNKWFISACPICKVPEWKLLKYSSTVMNQHYGAHL
ncbi:pyrrolysine--tRNA(Pyl) ligase small subunit [Desulfosporosinus sp.]|uniref:pyrrolysine--tRNA(Pyl) ligase small subunit n=1 Tax=Desulfosporosinus sp. TaxID=157907 RepID=UPI0025C4DBD7|nr:pyrrolysine--tRNA(Pyl) ligase small subunit [Desulfosporosinus sp.]MBC2724442.1 hypothetical protein [Desulfosporosinus sp.]MBC2725264.1 hypothetical protein [Desulfosporosinus sp.]